MIAIGEFAETPEGLAGHIATLTFACDVMLVPRDGEAGGPSPDYRVHAGSKEARREIGGAWKRIGENAGAYLAVQIDDPMLPVPLRALLFRADEGRHVLMWSRPSRGTGEG